MSIPNSYSLIINVEDIPFSFMTNSQIFSAAEKLEKNHNRNYQVVFKTWIFHGFLIRQSF